MKKVIFISLFIMVLTFNLFSQTNDCPSVNLLGPSSSINSGETMTFTAEIVGFDAEKHKIKWSVDNGNIIGDNKITTIEVDTTGLEDTTVVAFLEIEGLPETCQKKFSEVGVIFARDGCGCAFDDVGDIRKNDVRTRVDLFFVEVMNNPGATGYIVNYGSAEDVRKREKLIREQAKLREFDINRIVFQYKGEEKKIRTRLWIAPQGADTSCID